MFLVSDIKALFELTWEDIPYIENPVFAIEHVKDAIGGTQNYWDARVPNIGEFAHTHSLQRYSLTLHNADIEDRLRFLFSTGSYFSVARNKIPFAASFGWRELDNHPDGGEWYISHYNYADGVKQKLEAHAKYLGAKRRRMLAEQAEDDASAAVLISTAKRGIEKREKVDVDAVSRPDSKTVYADITIHEFELAKSEGSSRLHIQTREKICRYFLESNGFSESQIANAIGDETAGIDGGVDLAKPVEIMNFPPPEEMTQYVNSHGFPGNWFDPTSNQTPDELGLNAEGRTLTAFKVPVGQGLLSCSRPIVDTWTNPGNPVSTAGGGKQLFVNDATKKAVISLNKIGI